MNGCKGAGLVLIVVALATLGMSCDGSNPVETVDNRPDLAALLDYPLVIPFDSTSMKWNEVLSVQKSIPAVLDSVELQLRTAEETGDKESIVTLSDYRVQLERLQTLADSLVKNDEPIRCSVQLIELELSRALMEERGYAPEISGVFDKWQAVKLNKGPKLNLADASDELGNLAIDEDDFVLSFYANEGDSQAGITLDLSQAWSLMHLIHENETVLTRSSGREYYLELPFTDNDGDTRFFYLSLEFDKKLPDLRNWPRADRLNFPVQ